MRLGPRDVILQDLADDVEFACDRGRHANPPWQEVGSLRCPRLQLLKQLQKTLTQPE